MAKTSFFEEAGPTFTQIDPTVLANFASAASNSAANANASALAAAASLAAMAPFNGSPTMAGVAAAGASTLFARGDHVHPTDTTRASVVYTDAQDALRLTKSANLSDLANATTALTNLGLGSIRKVLTAPLTIYVRTDGNDSNTGLTNTSGGAKRNIQTAINLVARTIDPAQQAVTVQVADGTYNENLYLPPVPGAPTSGGVALTGNLTNPDAVVISGSGSTAGVFALGDANDWLIQGFKIVNPLGAGINGHANSWIRVNKVNIGSCVTQVQADHGGTVEIQGPMTLSGNCSWGFFSSTRGYVLVTGIAVTVTGTPTYSAQFTRAESTSLQMWSGGSSVVGSITGQRYYASGGHILSGTGSPTFFPGTVAGVQDNGGTYDGNLGIISSPLIQRLRTSGTAPTISGATGLGTGSASLVSGSNDTAGRILLTAGSGAGASGVLTVTFSAALGNGSAVVIVTPCDNTGGWSTPNIRLTGQGTGSFSVSWTNGSALSNGSAYIINYIALGA
jgi:hypothetical protein